MKLFLIIGGLLMIIFFCLVPLKRDIQEYKVQKTGEIVKATITYIPNCIGTKSNQFMKFTYAGSEFDKSVGCAFSDTHKVGDTINLMHNDGTDIFLFETENKESEFISAGLFAIIGISFIIMGARKK